MEGSNTRKTEQQQSHVAGAIVRANSPINNTSQTHSLPRSSNVIPALRDLSNEVRMAEAERSDDVSIPGKCNAAH